MAEGNRAAKLYLDQVFNLFSTRFDDGSRYPGSRQEIEKADMLLRKARMAKPDDPKVVYGLERAEEIVSAASNRVWCGSYIVLIFLLFITAIAFFGNGPRRVLTIFNWPSEESVAEDLQTSIQKQEKYLQNLMKLPDSNPKKIQRVEGAKARLAEIKKSNPTTIRKELISKIVWSGLGSLAFMIYTGSMLVLYVYSARTPRFLTKKRQREYELAKSSGDVIMKVFLGISGFLFGVSGALFSAPPTRWVYHYTDGSREYRDEHDGAIGGFLFLGLAFAFIIWVLHTVATIILYSIWAVVLFQYMRNYHYERLEIWKEELRQNFEDWKKKRQVKEPEVAVALPEPSADENEQTHV